MEIFHDWHYPQLGIFGFVLAIILLNGIFSVMRTKAKQETIRDLIKSGQTIDAETAKALGMEKADDDSGGMLVGGLILIAVAVGLSIMGYQIGKVETDEEVFQILLGVSAIPFMIGAVLIIASFFTRKKKGQD